MPLQHIDEEMLQLMRRETSRQHIEDLIAKMRAGIPGLAIRTTFITGFPGENDGHFESLLEFIERVRFERLGVFKYSQEEGSRAAKMDGQIPASVKNKRHARAMKLQQKIARELATAQQGRTIKVLVEQPQVARGEHDAPDVDCRVLLESALPVGQFAEVKVTGAQVYDVVAKPLVL
jgi:ribosomal protein S12 methylthiotransferase